MVILLWFSICMLYIILCDLGVSPSSRQKNWRKTMTKILTYLESKCKWLNDRLGDFIWYYPCLSFVVIAILTISALLYMINM